ncbi:C45 family autoproteolytic acyltransferase/hydrolase [Niallia sp. Sow4_A1]|uniref:C45 family autoproteolytic acyltransferase/hydolase n=1 Tax=Bacillaceae TaxID=186817 RepID=UPI0004E23891|nr:MULTISPECIES: C45 family peptidase [unclassified Bacillus (in: firmicutes)]
MKKFEVKIVQIREDSSFNIGMKTGQHILDSSLVPMWNKIFEHDIDYKNMRSIFSSYTPHLLEELEGLAQGLGISSIRAASMFSGYDVPKIDAMGCTAILTDQYYVRNYDFSPDFYDGIFSLVQSKTALATAGYNLQILGRHDGANQEGLVMGLNFVSYNGYTKGISPWTAIRMALDTCSTVDDAFALLKELPHSACYNFSLGDKKGNIAVIEATPEKICIRNDDSLLSCVNHFQTQELQEKNRLSIDGSIKRNNYLQSFYGDKLTQDEMFKIFANKRSPVFFTDYENLFGTLHTFSYSFNKSRIITSIAQGKEALDFNFNNWVNGKDIASNKMTGLIEKSNSFK